MLRRLLGLPEDFLDGADWFNPLREARRLDMMGWDRGEITPLDMSIMRAGGQGIGSTVGWECEQDFYQICYSMERTNTDYPLFTPEMDWRQDTTPTRTPLVFDVGEDFRALMGRVRTSGRPEDGTYRATQTGGHPFIKWTRRWDSHAERDTSGPWEWSPGHFFNSNQLIKKFRACMRQFWQREIAPHNPQWELPYYIWTWHGEYFDGYAGSHIVSCGSHWHFKPDPAFIRHSAKLSSRPMIDQEIHAVMWNTLYTIMPALIPFMASGRRFRRWVGKWAVPYPEFTMGTERGDRPNEAWRLSVNQTEEEIAREIWTLHNHWLDSGNDRRGTPLTEELKQEKRRERDRLDDIARRHPREGVDVSGGARTGRASGGQRMSYFHCWNRWRPPRRPKPVTVEARAPESHPYLAATGMKIMQFILMKVFQDFEDKCPDDRNQPPPEVSPKLTNASMRSIRDMLSELVPPRDVAPVRLGTSNPSADWWRVMNNPSYFFEFEPNRQLPDRLPHAQMYRPAIKLTRALIRHQLVWSHRDPTNWANRVGWFIYYGGDVERDVQPGLYKGVPAVQTIWTVCDDDFPGWRGAGLSHLPGGRLPEFGSGKLIDAILRRDADLEEGHENTDYLVEGRP